MCYLFYLLALAIGLIFPTYLATESIGLPMAAFIDSVSLIIIIVPSFFLVATASGTISFYKDNKYLEMWGDLGLKMGYIGTLIGLVLILAGMSVPPETGVDSIAKLGSSLAVAILTLLYGAIFKYMVIAPWLGCRKK